MPGAQIYFHITDKVQLPSIGIITQDMKPGLSSHLEFLQQNIGLLMESFEGS